MSQDSGWSKEGNGLRTATCLKTVAGLRKVMLSVGTLTPRNTHSCYSPGVNGTIT